MNTTTFKPVRWYFDADVRAMRDRVFEKPISDKEWANCRAKWMDDIPWLLAQCAKLDARAATLNPQLTSCS